MNKLIKTELNLAVGKNIRKLREQNGWNQEHIASQLNISIPAFSKIETGVTDANLSRLEQIAHIFELNIANLFLEYVNQEQIPKSAIELMQQKLADSETEIVALQRKIIQLYDEIHKTG